MPHPKPEDVIISVMTLRNAELAERIHATAAAGFKAIGVRLSDYQHALAAGMTADGIDTALRSAGLRIAEIEFLREWIGREQDAAYQKDEAALFAMARHFEARHINVGVFDVVPLSQVISSYTALCKRAARYNLLVQLEFMPYTPPVNTLKKAWEVVRAADQPNAGLLIDGWHFARTPGSADTLIAIPPESVTSIQLGDVHQNPFADIVEEARHHRHVPGEGALDIPAFLEQLHCAGVRAPLSVEVMSDALDAMPPGQAAQRVAAGLRTVLSSQPKEAIPV